MRAATPPQAWASALKSQNQEYSQILQISAKKNYERHEENANSWRDYMIIRVYSHSLRLRRFLPSPSG
jgi:hypothetical protein